MWDCLLRQVNRPGIELDYSTRLNVPTYLRIFKAGENIWHCLIAGKTIDERKHRHRVLTSKTWDVSKHNEENGIQDKSLNKVKALQFIYITCVYLLSDFYAYHNFSPKIVWFYDILCLIYLTKALDFNE